MSERSRSSSSVLTNPVNPVSRRARVDHFHVEAARSLSDGSSNPAEAHEAQRRTVDVAGQMVSEPPSIPAALSRVALCLGCQPGGGQDQEEGQVGCGVVEHPGRVAHRDAQRVSGRHVDVVVAHRRIRDDSEPA